VWEYPESINMMISAGRRSLEASRGGALKKDWISLYAFKVEAGNIAVSILLKTLQRFNIPGHR
jgi:hypothetical protein